MRYLGFNACGGRFVLSRQTHFEMEGLLMLVPAQASVEYLISRHLLKQLLDKGLITQDEFDRIDVENRKTFEK